jgi:hypothetical protein
MIINKFSIKNLIGIMISKVFNLKKNLKKILSDAEQLIKEY